VVTVAAFAYAIPEMLGAESINESVLERRTQQLVEKTPGKVIDTFVTVQKNSFAVGKQIRDIFWPPNLFVLSLKHDETRRAEVDEHGGKEIREGDILHVRYSTQDEAQTREELTAIVGEQVYQEKETDII
jgi:Trk K+ transport system NAD-binding subunit